MNTENDFKKILHDSIIMILAFREQIAESVEKLQECDINEQEFEKLTLIPQKCILTIAYILEAFQDDMLEYFPEFKEVIEKTFILLQKHQSLNKTKDLS